MNNTTSPPPGLSPEERRAWASLCLALRTMRLRLREAAVDSPFLSAELLLAKALGMDRQELLKRLLLEPETPLSNAQAAAALEYTRRRATGEPAAYILGEKEFYGRAFRISPAVLVPRPETELLVDLVLEHARAGHGRPGLFADFGTGSGCIAVTLSLELPGWRGIALDRSASAIAVAKTNAAGLGAGSLYCVQANFTAPPLAPGILDVLVSNPPYVSEEDYGALSREVRCFEPKHALVPCPASGQAHAPASPASGLEDALAILGHAHALLKPGGCLLLEIGCSQGAALLSCLDAQQWKDAAVVTDLAGLDRVLRAKKQ